MKIIISERQLSLLRNNVLCENLIREQEEKETLSPEQIQDIRDIQNTFGGYYGKWIIQRVTKKDIKAEDIYKFKDYFQFYNQGKKLNHFTFNDLGKYNNRELVKKFIAETINSYKRLKSLDSNSVSNNNSSNNYVSPNKIELLNRVGIKYLGMTENGYQCFKVPQGLDNEEAYNAYKQILGRCANRDKGERIEICTIANYSYFKDYVSSDDLYVFFNLGDPKSPYQFHYKEQQFMDKNDESLF